MSNANRNSTGSGSKLNDKGDVLTHKHNDPKLKKTNEGLEQIVHLLGDTPGIEREQSH